MVVGKKWVQLGMTISSELSHPQKDKYTCFLSPVVPRAYIYKIIYDMKVEMSPYWRDKMDS